MNRLFQDDDESFRAECRRRMALPLAERLFEGFVNRSETRDYELPQSRSFATTAEYRRWCHENLPPHLGYRIVDERLRWQPGA